MLSDALAQDSAARIMDDSILTDYGPFEKGDAGQASTSHTSVIGPDGSTVSVTATVGSSSVAHFRSPLYDIGYILWV